MWNLAVNTLGNLSKQRLYYRKFGGMEFPELQPKIRKNVKDSALQISLDKKSKIK